MNIATHGMSRDGRPQDDILDISGRPLLVNGSRSTDSAGPEMPAKKGFLRRLFGHVTKKEVLKDIAAGAGITLAVRWGSVFVLGGAGLTGLPLIATSAVAASVARTAWTIHKDRKAHALETGEKMSFWEWATRVETKKGEDGQDVVVDNKRKYMVSLGVSTAGAALGSYIVADHLIPRAAEYVAPAFEKLSAFVSPLTEKIANSNVLSTAFGFVAGLFGGAKPDAVLTSGPAPTPAALVPASPKPEVALKSWDELIGNGPRELPSYVQEILAKPAPAFTEAASAAPDAPVADLKPAAAVPGDAIQRRMEDAHALTTTDTTDPDPVQRRIEEAHAVAATPAVSLPSPEVTEYQVKRGDNLWKIAEKHYDLKSAKDIQSAVETIAAANNMSEGVQANRLSVGQVIVLPDSPAPVEGQPKLNWAALDAASASPASSAPAVAPVPALAAASAASGAASQDVLGDLIANLPADQAAAVPAAPAAANGATLQVTWSQNADGTIEGIVQNPPSWLKPGMQVGVPMVEIK